MTTCVLKSYQSDATNIWIKKKKKLPQNVFESCNIEVYAKRDWQSLQCNSGAEATQFHGVESIKKYLAKDRH